MRFISSPEAKKCIFHLWGMKYAFFASLHDINGIFTAKNMVKSSVYLKINFLVSQPKHMLWVLKELLGGQKHMFD